LIADFLFSRVDLSIDYLLLRRSRSHSRSWDSSLSPIWCSTNRVIFLSTYDVASTNQKSIEKLLLRHFPSDPDFVRIGDRESSNQTHRFFFFALHSADAATRSRDMTPLSPFSKRATTTTTTSCPCSLCCRHRTCQAHHQENSNESRIVVKKDKDPSIWCFKMTQTSMKQSIVFFSWAKRAPLSSTFLQDDPWCNWRSNSWIEMLELVRCANSPCVPHDEFEGGC
jgi:hypothetical protein